MASDYLLEQENKTYKANKTSLELLKQLKDSEVEIETLKNYIIDLKQRIAVYIPIKGDPTDQKLAEFINNYPERQKLKIMFMRESEGVYQFGTKRVYVRVDKDKINSKILSLCNTFQFVLVVVSFQLMSFLTNIHLQSWRKCRGPTLFRNSVPKCQYKRL